MKEIEISNQPNDNIINEENPIKKTLTPDKREKYDPLEKDDDDDDGEEIIKVTKKDNYKNIMLTLKKDIFSFISKKEILNNYPFLRVENTTKFIPQLSHESKILKRKKLIDIHSHLPYYQQYKDFKLLYSMDKDGTNITTIVNKGEGYEHTILLAKSDKYEVFGAYLSESLRILYGDFYGTAETFVFTFFDTDRIRVFPATRENDLYIYIRSGDSFASGGYRYPQAPYCFYQKIITNFKFNDIYIISQDKKSPVTKKLLSEYPNIKYHMNSKEIDISTLINAYNLVNAVSSFSLAAISFNDNLINLFEYIIYPLLQAIYLFHYDIDKLDRIFNVYRMKPPDEYLIKVYEWENTDEQRQLLFGDFCKNDFKKSKNTKSIFE